jgi:hypothetical protein
MDTLLEHKMDETRQLKTTHSYSDNWHIMYINI